VLSCVLKLRSQSVPVDISGSNTICNGACIVSCCSHLTRCYKFLHIDPYCCKFVIDSYALLAVDIMIFFSRRWNKTTLISTIFVCCVALYCRFCVMDPVFVYQSAWQVLCSRYALTAIHTLSITHFRSWIYIGVGFVLVGWVFSVLSCYDYYTSYILCFFMTSKAIFKSCYHRQED
jgi:hypothetical protein